jgi:hypothetical protein
MLGIHWIHKEERIYMKAKEESVLEGITLS